MFLYKYSSFSFILKDFFEPPLPPGWQWASTWTIEKSQLVDDDGWAYGPDFQTLKWPPSSSRSHMKSTTDTARRRHWIRTRQLATAQEINCLKSGYTSLSPGSSSPLPWGSTSKDSNQYLSLRPSANCPQPPYEWGSCVCVTSSFACGKDQPDTDQRSLNRQSTFRQESKTSSFALKLNQLEKKDMLFYCHPNSGSKQLWLSVGTDASVLNTEFNTPVYDWRISINSPLKLENRLPCQAKFTVWEKTKEGSFIEREHGTISSRKSAHIYSADIQRPIYITLFVHDGWVLEKVMILSTFVFFDLDLGSMLTSLGHYCLQDPILVLDLSSNDHVASFWMVHQRSKRYVTFNMVGHTLPCKWVVLGTYPLDSLSLCTNT